MHQTIEETTHQYCLSPEKKNESIEVQFSSDEWTSPMREKDVDTISFQTLDEVYPETEFGIFLGSSVNELLALNLNQTETDFVIKKCLDLLKCYNVTAKKMMKDCVEETEYPAIMDIIYDVAIQLFSPFQNARKRHKYFSANSSFVEPVEKAIGTRWEMKKKKIGYRTIHIPRLIQCNLQYVSIINSIKSEFRCSEFTDLYFKYNETLTSNVVGRDGSKKYSNFNSGSCFAKNELFQSEKYAIQLQISIDDYEPCNALQSKSGRHKICAVYFTIHNLPPKFASKLNNIFLICLCNSDDLKTKQTDYNNIWRMIVAELSELENGIMIHNTIMKGTLVHTAFDNLGANVALGFSGSFSSNKYCRHCLCSKTECQKFTSESQCTLRTVENYENSLDIVENSESVNLDETNGVKFYCELSDLNFYHIVENPTVDIMHDICEGCIPELLTHFIKFCFKNKIFSQDIFDNVTKCFDYGILNNSNIPSEVNLNKKTLGQNASQSLCLFRHFPLILYLYKDHSKLKNAWKCVQTLLQICEAVISYEITETENINLKKTIELHLSLFKETFERNLIPKQHFLLHYSNTIQKVGPLRHFSMMRFDAKHRTFKVLRNKTKNFKNINKTLAQQHQKLKCINGFSYEDTLDHGAFKPIKEKEIAILFKDLLRNFDDKLYRTKFVKYNSSRYSKDIVIVHKQFFFKIQEIVVIGEEYYFVCSQCVIEQFDSFLNSFKIKVDDALDFSIIKLSDLLYPNSHEIKYVSGHSYVISDSLDLRTALNQ